jgi:signal peptidase I
MGEETNNRVIKGETEEGKAGQGKKRYRTTVLQDFLFLLLKIAVIAGIVWTGFHYVYGAFRYQDLSMKPALKDGDLVFFYRLEKDYRAGDIVIYTDKNGKMTANRVIATAGDEVDVDEKGIKLNGAYQQEAEITSKTQRFEGGTVFPLTVPEGQLFVLGDNREHAADSRIYGCIGKESVKGKVIGIFRRRNF